MGRTVSSCPDDRKTGAHQYFPVSSRLAERRADYHEMVRIIPRQTGRFQVRLEPRAALPVEIRATNLGDDEAASASDPLISIAGDVQEGSGVETMGARGA